MKSTAINQRRWSRFGLLFFAAIVTFALLTFLGWMLGAVVVKRFPENFEWQVNSALRKGNVEQAESIVRKRIEKEHYDFGAHRLLAKVMLEANQPDKAVDTLLMSLDRMNTVSGRDVYTRGADPVATYDLLTSALLKQARTSFAQETQRIAADYSRLTTVKIEARADRTEGLKFGQSGPDKTQGIQLPLDQFSLSGGVVLTTSNTLGFSSAGSASIDVAKALPEGSAMLYVLLSGGKSLGLGGILKISLGDKTTFLAYADSPKLRWVEVSLPPRSYESVVPLTLQFVNDAYDSHTNTDRNIEVHQLFVQEDVQPNENFSN